MKVTLEFDTAKAANNFVSWWIDGGGEQYLGYDTQDWEFKEGWKLRVKGDGKIEDEEF